MSKSKLQKKCKTCKTKFTPFSSLATACSPKCAIEQARKTKERKARKALREGREKLKTKTDYLAEAQTACNAFIRERDKDEVCISCQKPPKKRNAGHYKSVGASPELRFHHMNIHLQCEHCNSWKSGNATEYRIRLIKKIGLENVEWLEGKQEAQNLTAMDIKEIKEYYKDQLKILKRNQDG